MLISGMNYSDSFVKSLYERFMPNQSYWDLRSNYHDFYAGIFSHDGETFFLSSRDKNIVMFDSRGFLFDVKSCIRRLTTGWALLDMSLNASGNAMIYCDLSDVVSLVDLAKDSKFSPFSLNGSRYVVSGSSRGQTCIWDLDSAKIVQRNLRPQNSYEPYEFVRDVAWHPHRNQVLSTASSGRLTYWGPAMKYGHPEDDPRTKRVSPTHSYSLRNKRMKPRKRTIHNLRKKFCASLGSKQQNNDDQVSSRLEQKFVFPPINCVYSFLAFIFHYIRF
ncbi:hypothetical protein Ciccas_010653 [Cichlidogyrus casuarinus]|uniref:Uncharacterized protein n=1 Tax=Cichlidogyrus casuarinus TaxID=1844966 RepID=A0ABD2PV73_9PLAT